VTTPADRLEHLDRLWIRSLYRLWIRSGRGVLVPGPHVVLLELATPKTWAELCGLFGISPTSEQHAEDRKHLLAMLRAARIHRLIESETNRSFLLSEDGYEALGMPRMTSWGPVQREWDPQEREALQAAVAAGALAIEPCLSLDEEARCAAVRTDTIVCGCGHVEPWPVMDRVMDRACPRCGESFGPRPT
jgi:hypothetical protein